MKVIHKHWHWLLPILPALLVTEKTAYLFSMMHYGDESFGNALLGTLANIRESVKFDGPFRSAFGSIFFFSFRSVPFAVTSVLCFLTAIKKFYSPQLNQGPRLTWINALATVNMVNQ